MGKNGIPDLTHLLGGLELSGRYLDVKEIDVMKGALLVAPLPQLPASQMRMDGWMDGWTGEKKVV